MRLWTIWVGALCMLPACHKEQAVAAPAVKDAGTSPPRAVVKDPVGLPAPRFEALPGWLGFATVGKDEGRHYWSPIHPTARAVVFTDAFGQTPKGAKLVALTQDGPVEVTYLGTSEVRYGCEENRTTMAAFGAPSKLREGPLWLLPPSQAEGAQVVPIQPGKTEGGARPSRSWQVDGLDLAAVRTAPLKGRFEVREGAKAVASTDFEKGYMEGADEEPLDVSNDQEVGLMIPLAAYRLGAGGPIVVIVSRRGYEGHNFQLVVKREGRPASLLEDSEGLYYCAF